jgi:hypothetical protein
MSEVSGPQPEERLRQYEGLAVKNPNKRLALLRRAKREGWGDREALTPRESNRMSRLVE